MELRAVYRKDFDGMNELFEAKRKVEELTFEIKNDVMIVPLASCNSLLVSVLTPYNGEYWDKKISEIMGDKKLPLI